MSLLLVTVQRPLLTDAYCADEWELSKENVKPRRKGRRVGALNKGLAAVGNTAEMHALQQQKKYVLGFAGLRLHLHKPCRNFEDLIARARDGSNPLALWRK